MYPNQWILRLSCRNTHVSTIVCPLLVTRSEYSHYNNEYLRDIASSIMGNFWHSDGQIKTNNHDQQQLSFVILLTQPSSRSTEAVQEIWQGPMIALPYINAN